MGPIALLGLSWGPSWNRLGALLGRFWAILNLPVALSGRSWGRLGPCWGRLEAILGGLGAIFGPLGAPLAPERRILKITKTIGFSMISAFWILYRTVLGVSWAVLEASWEHLERRLGPLEPCWKPCEQTCGRLGQFCKEFGHPGAEKLVEEGPRGVGRKGGGIEKVCRPPGPGPDRLLHYRSPSLQRAAPQGRFTTERFTPGTLHP